MSNHIDTVKLIMNKYKYSKLVLFGDYNLPNLIWDGETTANNISMILKFCFMTNSIFLGLGQYNYFKNQYDSILDLCFSDTYLNLKKAEALMTCDRYHPSLEALILFDNQYISLETNIYYNFHKADYGALNNYLLQINWIELYCLEDVNDILDAFYSIIWNAIELFVPKISIKRSNFPVWFSSELESKVIAKKIAHKKYKTTNKCHHYIEFTFLMS
uniref:Uncharacterized protein LOC114348719 n=1 Tax=Diabrotica virgifera virgifera TaxID=50390 RepID=A0A6P7HH84_DIAVI